MAIIKGIRQRLLREAKGQTITIQGLKGLFQGWPVAIHPQVDQLKPVINEWLRNNVQDEAKRKKMMMSEFAQFGASWWPYADFERMVTHLTLVLWVFVWDDTMDDETSEFFLDAEGASLARKEAIYVALECLGEHRIPASNKRPLGFIADSFRPIGEEIRKVSTPGQCKRIVADIRHFVEMTAHEQLHRLNTSALPSADTYWKFRQGTSAANICVSTIEASRGSQVPDHIMHDEDVLEVKRRTNEILSLTNDLLSLKKEIANGQFDNLIPLMAAESSSSYCDIQAGIDRSMEWLRESVNYFNAAASRISARADLADSGCQRELEEWVDGCKYFITGNISWSLRTPRYGLHTYGYAEDERDVITFTL